MCIVNPAGAWPLTFPSSKLHASTRLQARSDCMCARSRSHSYFRGFRRHPGRTRVSCRSRLLHLSELNIQEADLHLPSFWILQAIFAGIVVFEFVVIFSCWLYRLAQPSDPRQKDVRYAAYAQEHLSFWSSWREAELAEQQYLKEKRQQELRA